MTGTRRHLKAPYINPAFFTERGTGSCCWACARKDDCPMEAVGRKCRKDHADCPECTWWGERGCVCFAMDMNLLKM